MIKILTVYNDAHEKYLDTCISSVQNVFGTEAEHLIQYDWGKGQAWAVNQLLYGILDCDIIGFLDADDMACSAMKENVKHIGEYYVVYGDVRNYFNENSYSTYISQPMDFELFKKRNIIPVSGTLVFGEIAKLGVYANIFHGKDWHFWWSLVPHTKRFLYVPGVVAERRTWTSYKKCDIPVYRKLRRLYYNNKVKKLNSKYYVYTQ